MGNCFRNDKQALTNKNVIVKRIEKATELLEKLRNEGGEYKGIDYRENLDDVMDKLEKAGYFSGMALEEQKGENYAGKRSYFYKR